MGEYIIENITRKEWEILEDNNIDWCPDDMSGNTQDAIIFSKEEYDRAIDLIGRNKHELKGE